MVRHDAKPRSVDAFVRLRGGDTDADAPNGFRKDGLPLGVTFLAPGFNEARVAGIAASFHRATGLKLGKFDNPYSEPADASLPDGYREIAVVGAHLSGVPLNHELTQRSGLFRRAARTSGDYRLFALSGAMPPKPGLVRDVSSSAPIDVEVWALPVAGFRDFIDRIPAPLGVGKLSLEDGSLVTGFLCEAAAVKEQPEASFRLPAKISIPVIGWQVELSHHDALAEFVSVLIGERVRKSLLGLANI